MRRSLAAGLICLLGLTPPLRPAHALQFEQVPLSATEIVVGGRGPIVKGDTMRLQQALAAVPAARQFVALALDSPGGNVVEGEQLSQFIRTHRLPVVIPSGSKCASACFLLLAASPRRYAAADAIIGVHSASEDGEETNTSLAVTTLMARDAGELGIPPAIIGKMVQAKPRSMEWLTRADLTSMDVTVYDGDIHDATHQANVASVRPVVPSLPPPPSAPRPVAAPGFAAGRDDRRVWEIWFAGRTGPYRDGAMFAYSQLTLPQPGPCYGPNGANRGDFTLGCEVARQRLTPVAARLRDYPDYAAGWNSTGQPASPSVPTEAEYQGAYFCGRQMARLTLKLYPVSDVARRQAMLSFGPAPTSPDVPRGSFLVEGAIEPRGGEIAMTPVKWVSQPPGYDWLGLSGRSEDGGKTFSGRVTERRTCTIFSLKRVGGTP